MKEMMFLNSYYVEVKFMKSTATSYQCDCIHMDMARVESNWPSRFLTECTYSPYSITISDFCYTCVHVHVLERTSAAVQIEINDLSFSWFICKMFETIHPCYLSSMHMYIPGSGMES